MVRRQGPADWITHERFAALVLEAVESIPGEFQRHLERVEIVIEDQPDAATLRELGVDPEDGTLYGLYQGLPVGEYETSSGGLPDVIIIYAQPLCADFRDEYHLRREIRRTVIHEVGHFFGFDDAELEKKGYG